MDWWSQIFEWDYINCAGKPSVFPLLVGSTSLSLVQSTICLPRLLSSSPKASEIQSVMNDFLFPSRNDLFFSSLALYLFFRFVSHISPTCSSRDRAYRALSKSTMKTSPSYRFVFAFADAFEISQDCHLWYAPIKLTLSGFVRWCYCIVFSFACR